MPYTWGSRASWKDIQRSVTAVSSLIHLGLTEQAGSTSRDQSQQSPVSYPDHALRLEPVQARAAADERATQQAAFEAQQVEEIQALMSEATF